MANPVPRMWGYARARSLRGGDAKTVAIDRVRAAISDAPPTLADQYIGVWLVVDGGRDAYLSESANVSGHVDPDELKILLDRMVAWCEDAVPGHPPVRVVPDPAANPQFPRWLVYNAAALPRLRLGTDESALGRALGFLCWDHQRYGDQRVLRRGARIELTLEPGGHPINAYAERCEADKLERAYAPGTLERHVRASAARIQESLRHLFPEASAVAEFDSIIPFDDVLRALLDGTWNDDDGVATTAQKREAIAEVAINLGIPEAERTVYADEEIADPRNRWLYALLVALAIADEELQLPIIVGGDVDGMEDRMATFALDLRDEVRDSDEWQTNPCANPAAFMRLLPLLAEALPTASGALLRQAVGAMREACCGASPVHRDGV